MAQTWKIKITHHQFGRWDQSYFLCKLSFITRRPRDNVSFVVWLVVVLARHAVSVFQNNVLKSHRLGNISSKLHQWSSNSSKPHYRFASSRACCRSNTCSNLDQWWTNSWKLHENNTSQSQIVTTHYRRRHHHHHHHHHHQLVDIGEKLSSWVK